MFRAALDPLAFMLIRIPRPLHIYHPLLIPDGLHCSLNLARSAPLATKFEPTSSSESCRSAKSIAIYRRSLSSTCYSRARTTLQAASIRTHLSSRLRKHSHRTSPSHSDAPYFFASTRKMSEKMYETVFVCLGCQCHPCAETTSGSRAK